jgi:translation initiation factor IF-2
VGKRRIYDIAKDRGLTSQELVERLQSAGLEVKSSACSIEEAEVDRVLKTSAKSSAKPAAPTKKAVASAREPAAPTKKAAASARKAGPKAAVAMSPAKAEAADGSVSQARPREAAKVQGEGPQAKATESKTIRRVSEKRAINAPQPPTGEPTPKIAAEKQASGERPLRARADDSRVGVRKPAKPRGRGTRLDDLPTVVGPGVPLRRGVSPPDHVLTKEELVRLKAQRSVKPETVEKQAGTERARSSAPGQEAEGPGARGGKDSRASSRDHSAPSRLPGLSGRGPAGARPSTPGSGVPAGRRTQGSVSRSRRSGLVAEPLDQRERSQREASVPIPDLWAEAAEATGLVAPGRGGGSSRVRRGEDRPTKRRVIIDSQAGRKGGKGGPRDRRPGTVGEAERPTPKKKLPPGTESPVKIKSGASVKDLAEALELSGGELIKTLMRLGEMVTITQSLSDDAVLVLAEEFERKVEIEHAEEETETIQTFVDDPADLSPRAPVVTIMGHVDHGKTSLLDAIRETEVVKGEAGGITQHIGAYQVTHQDRKVTFLDTPGHEAFTAMRARGARSTDIAVIVVAANDGVMPQTLEAISHAKAAEVPIVVAINKMDLPDANSDMVKKQLADEGLVPEAWGGDTVLVEVSAKQKLNLDELMDMILLVAEVQELQANANAPASGVVIEAQLDVGRGPVATVLVQRGTLRVGDSLVCGEAHGKVKAMFDFTGNALGDAGPSVPVQILGFNSPPVAGDFVAVVKDERAARQRAEQRTARLRQEQLAKSRSGATSLEEFYRRLKEDRVKELPLVIKGDVGGSVEALEEVLQNVSHPEVKVAVVFAGVGGINESDIMLAAASKAVVIGFNVRPSAAAKMLAEQERVDVRTYRVIYKAIEDVEAALVGMLEPEEVEEELGTAEVRQVFHASRVGTIAGCYVQSGKILRSAKVRLVRDGHIVHEGTIDSLKRFTEDAREVLAGYECGLHLDGFDDIHEGDILEAYEIKEVARTH